MTQRSLYNNTNVALKPFGVFTGAWESTNVFLEIAAYLNSTAYLAISIQQSQDASAVNINTTYNYTPNDEVSVYNTAVGLPFYRIILNNEANVQVAHMSLTTLLVAVPNNPVTINGVVTGNMAITSPLDAMGNVKVNAENLINEVNATRRVDFLVVGDWYRVASVGLTSGAQWNAIGAIVDGESVPAIGRLFKCLSIGPAVAGGGTCYDMPYTTDVSATITNFPSFPATQPVSIAQDLSCNILNFPATQPVSGTISLTDPTSVRIRDAYGDPITTTAGNLMVGISNIYTANPLHTIVDSGPATQAVTGTFFQATQPVSIASSVPVTGTFFQATQPVSGTISLTDPTSVRVRDAYGDPITTTAGNLNVNLNAISTATALHTIVDSGSVSLSGTNNGVKVNPTAQPPVRVTGLGDTAKAIGGPGLLYGASYQNKSVAVDCWIKLYNKATAPTSADTPFLIQYLESVQQYNLTHANDNFFNAPITNTLWVRATLLPADNDTTDTDIDAEVTAFVGT